ncbi:MAG TPA: M28 family metallopeptidase [Bacteroidales bacterium]|nr:M28 family metallopeptidase [Bacteroidales bacterium]
MKNLYFLVIAALLFPACNNPHKSLKDPEAMIDTADLAGYIKVLSSDEFEGRAPSSPGEQKTITYLTDQFKKLGLQPGNGDSYLQEVPLVGIAASPDMSLVVKADNGENSYTYGEQFIAASPLDKEEVDLNSSDIVFVGYGIVAPEYNRNDYAGLDVKGKTVLMLVNDPGYTTKDSSYFMGNAMTYYGRWTYKYEEAGRQGAAAAIIIHQTGAAGYPWSVVKNSWSGPQFYQAGRDASVLCPVQGWITEDVARQWFSEAGMDMAKVMKEATAPDFKPLPMNMKASLTLHNTVKHSVSHNVMAAIPGKTNPDETIIYTAHWDHLGRDTTLKGDQIYNGALDNASGVAGLLELAEAFKAAGQPQRTVLFIAVTGEEQGLLGSAYYADHPVYPIEKTVANINMDALDIYGPMKDITDIGYGKSTLDQYLEKAAKAQSRYIRPDQSPEKGFYYRSDHFSFAKKGVPSLYTGSGIDHESKGEEWTRKQQEKYTAEKYHKPADEYSPDWDLTGAVKDLKLLYTVGHELANNTDWPVWNEGVSFKKIRDKSSSER